MSGKKAKRYVVLRGFETDDRRWEPSDKPVDLDGLTATQVKWAVGKGLVEEVD